ncbi:hypothetical protein [Candidatus Palauibacter sp.]|uniref:hypothetical protein n=1 Tax=Candidatus Palauibacter sp. TaxID=3101350 RepID=UPI003B019B12
MSHVRRSLLPVLASASLVACLSAQPALAQGTPWIAEPGTGSIGVSYVNQNAHEFYRETTSTKGPLEATGANLAQNTVWIGLNYALHDAVALDVQTAWARSFVAGAAGPAGGQESYSGLFDSNIAVTWRIVDELVSNAPSVAVRVGAIIAGGYETGYINSLGDGGSGVETSLIIGKFWDAVGVSAEAGYRNRGSTEVNPEAVGAGAAAGETVDIPADMFFNLWLFVPVGSRVTLGVDYRMVNALSGIDIGGDGFSPSRFPGLEENAQIVGGRLLADVTDTISMNAFFGQVVAGRNTAKSRIFGVGLSVGFGGSFGGGF